MIRKVIAGLRRIGLRKCDTVSIHSLNDLHYPVLVLGIIGAGGVFTGTNPAYTQRELTHHLRITKAKFVIAQSDLLNVIGPVADKLGIPRSKILRIGTSNKAAGSEYGFWTALLARGEHDWLRFDNKSISESTIAALCTTSGTTSLPKAAVISITISLRSMFSCTNTTYYLIKLPDSTNTSALKSGHHTYIMRRFELQPFLAAIERFQITDLIMVPPMTIAVIMSPLRHKYSIKSLKWVCVGAAPLDKAPQQKFAKLMDPETPYTQALGMTETSCLSARFDGKTFDDTGSIGQFLPNLDIKLVDGDSKDITAWNVSGELCIRGPIVSRGYFENPDATAQAWESDGYYHSGDIAFGDSATKKWYIVDRKKELIKVKAYQVTPPEIEGVLLDHPGIADAAVIGIIPPGAVGQGTELPRAYVVKKKNEVGARLTESNAQEWVQQRLAYYKRLEGGVAFIDAVPRTASGKILKRVLRERAAKETGAKL